jgi:UDP-3-O-acyl-N-acetylglucosamine deacetylase
VSNAFTISHPVGPFSGVGLFTGAPCAVTIAPGARGEGISIRRRGGDRVRAHVDHVNADTSWSGLPQGVPVRNTTLGVGDSTVATVEHILSALAALSIWDASIEVDGPEVPVLDGSSLEFLHALLRVRRDTHRHSTPIVLTREVRVGEGHATIVATPRDPGPLPFSYTYRLDYGPGAPIAPHEATWTGGVNEYERSIAPARTFSLVKEALAAKESGLFKHLTPADVPVIGDDGKLVENEWRFEGEPAAHKLLDLIGDLALLGAPLHADVVATRSGHALTHALCREVLKVMR